MVKSEKPTSVAPWECLSQAMEKLRKYVESLEKKNADMIAEREHLKKQNADLLAKMEQLKIEDPANHDREVKEIYERYGQYPNVFLSEVERLLLMNNLSQWMKPWTERDKEITDSIEKYFFEYYEPKETPKGKPSVWSTVREKATERSASIRGKWLSESSTIKYPEKGEKNYCY
ncbi:unnamed protein product [Haemonchus placei]|uniref:Coiled-coil domain containing 112 n=1 Tax=Haemonchus placei TaxID=6290 RepID=A0A0N4WM57_HAEPC|nr:unnamed protein product [Haemonchus placei]